jgi:hypothetical protein
MKMLWNAVFVLAVAAMPVAAFVSVTSAEPAPPVGRHRHYVIASSGEKVYIGPDFCNMDVTTTGFAQFHANVHLSLNPPAVLGEACQ